LSKQLHELLQSLTTEMPNIDTQDIDLLGSESIMQLIHNQDKIALDAVKSIIPELSELASDVADRWQNGGRIIYVGAGTSGRLGVIDAAELPPTYSIDPARAIGVIAGGHESLILSREGAEDKPEDAVNAIAQLGVQKNDSVIGISASFRTPFAIAGLEEAHRRGALTGYLVCNHPIEPMSWLDHLVVAQTGPETITGSTRMKAALAQKMMLTMFSTTVMVLSGKVFGNLMVDMKMTSAKLEERAAHLVMSLANVEYDEAKTVLTKSSGSVKAAVVMLKKNIDLNSAEKLLKENNDRLRKVLEGID
jgi:N-acetylmuramic acid 6-phosphate etherase